MRKAITWLAAIAAIGAVAGSGGWYAFRPSVEAQLQALFDDARRQGIDLRYETLEIGGFPLGYEAVLSEVFVENARDGWSALFPTASGVVSLFDPNAVAFSFPDRFTMTMAQEVGGERILLHREVTSENMTARLARGDGEAVDYAIAADRLRVAPTETETDDHLAATDVRIEGALAGAGAGAPDALDMRLTASGATAQIALQMGERGLQDVALTLGAIDSRSDLTERGLDASTSIETLRIEAVDGANAIETALERITVDIDATPSDDAAPDPSASAADRIAAMLLQAATGRGVADVAVKVASWRQVSTSTALGAGDAIQTISIGGVDAESALSMSGDRMSAATTAGPTDFAFDGAAPVRGRIERSEMAIDYPLRADAGRVQVAALSYDLSDVSLDDATWAWLDPEGAMPRAMPGLSVEAALGVEILEDFFVLSDEGAPALDAAPTAPDDAAQSPVRFRTAQLDALTLDLLGLKASATAHATFDALTNTPNGKIEATITDWRAFLDNASRTPLGQSGLVAQAAFMLEQFTRPVDETTSRIDVEFQNGAIIINGEAIGG